MTCETTDTEIVAGNIAHVDVTFTRAGTDTIVGTTATVTVIELDGTTHDVTPITDVDDTAGTVNVVGDWPIPADHADGRIVVRTVTDGPLVGVREDAFMVVAQT